MFMCRDVFVAVGPSLAKEIIPYFDTKTLGAVISASTACRGLVSDALRNNWYVYVVGYALNDHREGGVEMRLERYNVSTDEWDTFPHAANHNRWKNWHDFVALCVLNGNLYVLVDKAFARLNFTTMTWDEIGHMPVRPTSNVKNQAVAVDGYIYACGSHTSPDTGSPFGFTSIRVARYCEQTGAWELVAPVLGICGIVEKMRLFALKGHLYAFASRCQSSSISLQKFNPSGDSWESMAALHYEGLPEAALSDSCDDDVFTCGSCIIVSHVEEESIENRNLSDRDGCYLSHDGWCYHSLSDQWSAMRPMPTIRRLPNAVGHNGVAYFIGGLTQHIDDMSEEVSLAVEGYVHESPGLRKGAWRRCKPVAHEAYQLCLSTGYHLLALGGRDVDSPRHAEDNAFWTVERFASDAGAGNWVEVQSVPTIFNYVGAAAVHSGHNSWVRDIRSC